MQRGVICRIIASMGKSQHAVIQTNDEHIFVLTPMAHESDVLATPAYTLQFGQIVFHFLNLQAYTHLVLANNLMVIPVGITPAKFRIVYIYMVNVYKHDPWGIDARIIRT